MKFSSPVAVGAESAWIGADRYRVIFVEFDRSRSEQIDTGSEQMPVGYRGIKGCRRELVALQGWWRRDSAPAMSR